MRINQFPRLLLVEWRKLKLPTFRRDDRRRRFGRRRLNRSSACARGAKTHNKLFDDICVAHLDHGLRKSSSKDAKWVAELATKLGFRSVIGRSKVAENARAASDNIEQAATRGSLRIS